MFKKLLFAVAAFIATMGIAFAQVDVNKADQAALDGVKGIGPATSKAIIAERKKGDFKDWADIEKRVKGIGEKKAAALSKAGLTVNGQAMEGAAPSASASAKADKKTGSASASASAGVKADKKAGSASASAPASASASAPAAATAPASGSASASAKKK